MGSSRKKQGRRSASSSGGGTSATTVATASSVAPGGAAGDVGRPTAKTAATHRPAPAETAVAPADGSSTPDTPVGGTIGPATGTSAAVRRRAAADAEAATARTAPPPQTTTDVLVARLYLAARVVVACLLVYVAWDTIKSFSEMAGGPRETIRELPPEGAPQPGPTSATQTDKPATPGTSVDDSRPVAGFRPDSRLGGLAGLGGIGGGWEFQGIPYKLHSEEVDAKSADARLLVPPDPAHLGGGTEDVDVEMLKVLMPRLKLQRVEADGWLQYRSEPGDFRVVAFCRKRGNRELFAAGRLMLKQEDGKARLLEVSPTPAVSGAGKAAASAAPVILPMPPGSTVFAVRRDSGREVLAEMVELPANSRAGLPRLWKSAGWLVEPLPGRSDTTEGAVCRLADDDGKGPLVTAWYLDVGGGKGDGLAVLTKMAGDAGGPKRP